MKSEITKRFFLYFLFEAKKAPIRGFKTNNKQIPADQGSSEGIFLILSTSADEE